MELFRSSDCNGRVVQFGNRHGITKVPFWHAKLTNIHPEMPLLTLFEVAPHKNMNPQKNASKQLLNVNKNQYPHVTLHPAKNFPGKKISPPKAITKSVAEITVMALPLSSVIVRLDTPGRHVETHGYPLILWWVSSNDQTVCVCVCSPPFETPATRGISSITRSTTINLTYVILELIGQDWCCYLVGILHMVRRRSFRKPIP